MGANCSIARWLRLHNEFKQGITLDLEAMKRIGIGGAQIFNVDVGIPSGSAPFMSPQWRECILHAAKEAKRLGLELCVHNSAGWSSSGGPWITPDHAMQRLTFSEQTVSGLARLLDGPETLSSKRVRPSQWAGSSSAA